MTKKKKTEKNRKKRGKNLECNSPANMGTGKKPQRRLVNG
jgi:hypothetical protein